MNTDHLNRFAEAAWARVHKGYYAPKAGRCRPRLSLAQQIRAAPQAAVIAEIKPRSPTGGELLGGRDPRELASAYAAAGARGISVLTEPDHFGGSVDVLAGLTDSALPLLAKDFVVDPVQLAAFASWGADCALLILSLFALGYPSLDLDGMLACAGELGLEVLLEVASGPELRRALATEADLIGVNSRDLATLEVDLGRAAAVLEEVVPGVSKPILALSGISSGEDIKWLRGAGFSGFLVGSSLLKASDPAAKLRELVTA